MKSFPEIKRQKLITSFDAISTLFESDQVKLLDAAERALAEDPTPFVKNGGAIQPQIATVRHRVQRVAENYGRNVLVKLIEELQIDLNANGGAIGVNNEEFSNICSVNIENEVKIKLNANCRWVIEWEIPSQEGSEIIPLPIRDRTITQEDIVPNYIIQYVHQSIVAYRNKNYLTSLSLISIALEGTLRDVLEVKGFTYSQGAPSEDVYDLTNMEVSKDVDGYKVKFPGELPSPFTDFLTEEDATVPCNLRLKRIYRRGKWFIEIRDVDYIKNFWTSDVITQEGQKNIGGLGTALKVARNEAAVLDNSILPDDMDEVIQQVRNNLIHLSGTAMSSIINSVGISLDEFSKNQARVFDSIWSIVGAIETLYLKKANETL